MILFRPDIPPHVAEVIHSFHPDLKRSVKAAVRGIATDPECRETLLCELDGLWKYRVRRFWIVYAVDCKRRVIRLMADGHRRHVYEELTVRLTRKSKSSRVRPSFAARLVPPLSITSRSLSATIG